jgi:rhamnosyltransferase
VLENLTKLRTQVQALVVVDNGSSEQTLAPLRTWRADLAFELIENGENLGIATALNVGVRWARSHGYNWVALFDQDSSVTDGFMDAMLSEYMSRADKEKIAIVTPINVQQGNERSWSPGFDVDGSILATVTSGSLMPCHIFDRCGWFEDDLIIDLVDTEYCLRVRSRGFHIVLAESARLIHKVGEPTYHCLAGKGPFRTTNHSAQRRYYITRNSLVVNARYSRIYPKWYHQRIKALIRETAIALLFEDHRMRKLVAILRGLFDVLRGRMGKAVDL